MGRKIRKCWRMKEWKCCSTQDFSWEDAGRRESQRVWAMEASSSSTCSPPPLWVWERICSQISLGRWGYCDIVLVSVVVRMYFVGACNTHAEDS